VRLAALSQTKVIFSWTHDSIGLGEDGPTHQPVEQLAAMRAMPNLLVIRPADANETAQAVRIAIRPRRPNGPHPLPSDPSRARGHRRARRAAAAWRLHALGDEPGPDIVLVGTGSEVWVCAAAAKLLEADGLHVRVVSMPSWSLFEDQGEDYQDETLGAGAPVLAVEAAASFGWSRWADATVSLDHFGASGPGAEVLAHFGFTPENVAENARPCSERLTKTRRKINDASHQLYTEGGQSPWIDNLFTRRHPFRAPREHAR